MNIFGMGPMELLLIIVLALIVFGPAKLPEIMGQVGKAVNDFRRATSELSDEFNRTIQSELQEGRSVLTETKTALSDVHTSVNSAVLSSPAPVRVAVPGEGIVTANGTVLEQHADGDAVSSAGNGDVAAQNKPALADTSQWSWETAAPAAPKPELSTPAEPPAHPDPASSGEPGQAQQATHQPHDDTLPPY